MASYPPPGSPALPADVRLSKYNPLSRILFFDDFDEGMNGWCELVGNHVGNLDDIRPIASDFRPPQLSSCTYFDIGTHGSLDGTYSLKLATRPQANHSAIAIKRATSARQGLVQLETYFAFKADQTFGDSLGQGVAGSPGWDGNAAPSEQLFGEFTLSNDICDSGNGSRYHGVVRYRNTGPDGRLLQQWMHPTTAEPTTKMDRRGEARSDDARQDFFSAEPGDWLPLPGGRQPLCFNETASKVNWHYLRWLFDTRRRCNMELECNDRLFNMQATQVPVYEEPYHGLSNLLNFYFAVRTHCDVRNFLYLDSVLVSVDW